MRHKTELPFSKSTNVKDSYMSIDELMCAFHSCKTSDPLMANDIAIYAIQCGSVTAKFEYSKFLRTTPNPSIPTHERYKKAETILLELLNILETPIQFRVDVALELGTLYSDCLNRPVGALSLYLFAQRLGATVEEYKLKKLQAKIKKMDINHIGSNCVDALRFGYELYCSNKVPNLAEFFLREAVDKASEEKSIGKKGSATLYGQACLMLGDFYDSRIHTCESHERTTFQVERDRMYAEAKASGYPDYLRRRNLI